MGTWRKVGCCLVAAVAAFGAWAYDDDYVSIDDEAVVQKVADGRIVYVFTNTAAAATVTLKQTMTLEEALVVGGGGAGGWGYVEASGNYYGCAGGGGGGGVILTNAASALAAGSELFVTIGEGGDPTELFDADSNPHPRGGNGHPSVLAFGTVELTAFGGGGGGSYAQGAAGTGKLGSSGGMGGVGNRDYRYSHDGVYHTSSQGNLGVIQTGRITFGGGGGAGQFDAHVTPGNGVVCAGCEGLHVDLIGEDEVYGSGGGSGYASKTYKNGGGAGGTNAGRGGYQSNAALLNGVDGFGGGGGGNGRAAEAAGGRGGSGTVVLAFRVGDTASGPHLEVSDVGRIPLANGVAEPALRVSCGGQELTVGEDYEVSFANNRNRDRIAMATVRGLGTYAGLVAHKTFEVFGRVIYVAPEAKGSGDGSSWANATLFTNALALATTDAGNEIWMKAGTYPVTAGFTTDKAIAIRGGFAGDDDEPQRISSDRYSVIDGGDGFANAFSVTQVKTSFPFVTIERCWFRRGKQHALNFNSYYGLRLFDCKMTGTQYGGGQSGRGLYATSSASAPVTLVDCEVSDNTLFVNYGSTREAGNGCGASLTSVNAYLQGCLFASNGMVAAYSPSTSPNSNHKGTILYSSGSLIARGCRFVGNRGTSRFGSASAEGGGLCYLASGGTLENCAWIANYEQCGSTRSGIRSGTVYGMGTVNIRRCTFAYNIVNGDVASAGLHMASGTAAVEDSVFFGNSVFNTSNAGADIYLEAAATAFVSNTLFATDAADVTQQSGFVASADPTHLELADDVVFGNPQFVTSAETFSAHVSPSTIPPLVPVRSQYASFAAANNDDIYGFDVHLLSPGGYYTNDGTWHEKDTDKTSEAILSSGENLGCYAGTPEESKLAEVAIEFVGDVTVTFPDGTSQPTITFELGGNGGVPYNAKVEIEFGVEGDRRTITIPSVASGAPYAYLAPYAFLTNVAFTARVIATIAGGSESQDALPAATPNAYPETYGHGGKGVIHVRSGATGLGDGSSWFDAMTDFHAAMNALSAECPELWLAGTNVMSYVPLKIAPPVEAVVRGGFTGTEDSIAARARGEVSVIDGVNRYQPLTIGNAHELQVERIEFTRGPSHNVVKTGAGDVVFTDCRFTKSVSANGTEGRGIHLTGGGATVARFVRCAFCDNVSTNLSKSSSRFAGRGVGASFFSCGCVKLEDSVFRGNGIAIGTSDFRFAQGSDNHGAAVYASGAPVVARNCRFVANALPGNTGDEAGTVSLAGACGGSAFTNCLFAGNESYVSLSSEPTFWSAALVANLAQAEDTVDVVNCTFAYNLTGAGATNAADVCIRNGSAKIRSSVFIDAYLSASPNASASVLASASAGLDIAYSIFPRTNSVVRTGQEGAFAYGPGVVFGDPLLVTPIGGIVNLVRFDKEAQRRFTSGTQATLEAIDAHLRGRNGYLDEVTGEVVKWSVNSPAIDAGDPRGGWRGERKPCGWRVNMGFYGNTPNSTMSRYGTVILIDGKGTAQGAKTAGGSAMKAFEDVVVCGDGLVRVYNGQNLLWTWDGTQDTAVTDSKVRGKLSSPTESKPIEGGAKFAISSSPGAWAIVDRKTGHATAWGSAKGWPHTIEILPDGIVAVGSTDTTDAADEKGVTLFDISGEKATNPSAQNATFFPMDNPHGLYWDASSERLYVASSTGLHKCRVGYEGGTFSLDEETLWPIAELGLTHAHDLRRVPGTSVLAVTTVEKLLFFDMSAGDWLRDRFIFRTDAKGFDPHADGKRFLVTVPRTSWVTDTLELYTAEDGFTEYVTLPGTAIYKSRWCPACP